MTMDIENIREEIINFLRNSNIFTTTVRGVATQTDTYTATSGQVAYTLTKAGVRNIRAVSVNSVSKAFLTDYTVNWNSGILTLNTGATLNDPVSIQYDWGTGDKIYPDYPRADLTLNSFPRIGMELIGLRTENFGLGGASHISDILLSVFVFVPLNKDTSVSSIFGTESLSDLISSVRDKIRTGAKSFVSFGYIYPTGTSPIIKGQNDKIIHQNADFTIKFVVEN